MILVQGIDQIQRDMARLGLETDRAMAIRLRDAAEPVAHLAEALSLREIRRMPFSPAWADVRIGVTRHSVYIAPKKRGVKSGNPFDPRRRGWNIKGGGLVPLMMGRSFEPAGEVMAPVVQARVSALLGTVIR